jgi:5-methylcytosine-specific restriction endonuclease McrA
MDREHFAILRMAEAVGQKSWGRNYAMQCPKCQHTRQRHQRARPLNVKRSVEGILYHCWHCGLKGFLPNTDRAKEVWPKRRPPKKKRGSLKLPAWI